EERPVPPAAFVSLVVFCALDSLVERFIFLALGTMALGGVGSGPGMTCRHGVAAVVAGQNINEFLEKVKALFVARMLAFRKIIATREQMWPRSACVGIRSN